ncbi:hypothetical protein M408DRAFT_331010 [Serendipita vermifera MAFF 305830]|uniref:Uncharacterized protein n=1 Tax=Serendipita vermifera MAFF 305830 TaxID=933852 RepID=A0A0C3AM46_SERVB|nr:hypothetical protein M408DRAFT_331010 [Serendipita vermifera MAFF 305830]
MSLLEPNLRSKLTIAMNKHQSNHDSHAEAGPTMVGYEGMMSNADKRGGIHKD